MPGPAPKPLELRQRRNKKAGSVKYYATKKPFELPGLVESTVKTFSCRA